MTEPSTIERGTRVWLKDGRQALYEALLPDGRHLVMGESCVYGYAEEEPWIEPTELLTVEAVYRKKPVAIIDEEIAAKREEIAALEQAIADLVAEGAAKQKEQEAELGVLGKIIGLETLKMVAKGAITHIVEEKYGKWGVFSKEDKKNERRSVDSAFKLLTLWGRTGGDFEWKINEYSDGSGSDYRAWPFGSEEEAKAFCRLKILEAIETAADLIAGGDPPNNSYNLANTVACAKQFEIDVPPAVREFCRERKRGEINRQIKDLEGRMATYRDQLEKLEEEPAA